MSWCVRVNAEWPPQVRDGGRPVQAKSDNGELGGTRGLVWREGDGLEWSKVMNSYHELGIGRAHLESLQILLLKVWSSKHPYQHHLGAGKKCRISSPALPPPKLLNQTLCMWFMCTLKSEKHCLLEHARKTGFCLSSLWRVLCRQVTHPHEHFEKITWVRVAFWRGKVRMWGKEVGPTLFCVVCCLLIPIWNILAVTLYLVNYKLATFNYKSLSCKFFFWTYPDWWHRCCA